MNEKTPSDAEMRSAWAAFRLLGGSAVPSATSKAEFDRFLAAHDQGIRDAVKLTAREHMDAAWEAAHPVPPNVRIPKGTEYLVRISPSAVPALRRAGRDFHGSQIVRTLDPLPPVIPDDCDYVWASAPDDMGERSIWTRTSDGRWESRMPRGSCTVQYPESDLIDPKPVPEEER